MPDGQKQGASSRLVPDWSNSLAGLSNQALKSKLVRHMVFDKIRSRTTDAMYPSTMIPAQVIEDQKYLLGVIIDIVEDGLDKKEMSDQFVQRVIHNSIRNLLFNSDKIKAREKFKEEYGEDPPGFITLSPGKACNLQCKGCYASSGHDKEKLDWDVFDEIITQSKELWGSWFVTVTGGEPMVYRSQGKGVLDAMEKHNDCMFLMYTNGTLINKETAARIAELGNVTPAISVEGMRESTDDRRGEGVHARILAAMENLREVKVPFGISLTPTRLNCQEILSDEVIDFYQQEQRAKYAWMFQYMPIGRGFTLNLMVTPEQRAWMWERTWQIVREKKFFMADFWNFGTASGGCISAGKSGGYMYIDWNGKVMPCVFFPYSPVNINEAFQQGKDLNDVRADPFFTAVRDWQKDYANVGNPEETGNWIKPCPMRDHHADARRIINMYEPDPEDEMAAEALSDPDYYEGLVEYDRKLDKVLDPIWERHYLSSVRQDKSKAV